VIRLVVIVVLALSLTACGVRLWPFGKRTPPQPVVVNEAVFESATGAVPSVPQYWKRNTLILDLQSLSGQGEMIAKPREGSGWPVRVAVRTRPGSVGELDIRALQRVVLAVPQEGSEAVDFVLPPTLVRADTPQLTIAWGSRRDPEAPSAVPLPLETDTAPTPAPAAPPAPAAAPESTTTVEPATMSESTQSPPPGS
jgi:hypothetical protein